MPRNWMTIAGAAALLTASVFTTAGRLSAAPTGSRWGANYFPNVPLITQDGKTVRFYDDLLKGKTVAIYLMYTTCQYACPLETARVAQVQKFLNGRVGKDIFFYSITIDPKHDTPEVMKAYAEQYHAGPGWQFLTGKPEDIELISKKLGLYSAPDPANKDGHIPSLLIGDEPTGQWMSNSALDNPRFLAMQIGDLLNTWKNRREMPSYADAPSMGNADSGKYHFSTKCAACHTIGKGDSVGPDLLGVTNFRNREWLAHYIQAPNELLAAKDSIAVALFAKYKQVRMPNLRLGGEEVSAIIGFLESESAAYMRTVSSGSRKILYYVDPMHRSYKSNKPGTAPDCGMKLEPVYADDLPAGR